MSGIGVIVNPLSKRHRGDRRRTLRLARIVGDRGVVAECKNLDELHRTAEDFRQKDVSILAIGGGDGTNSVTATRFWHVYGDVPLPSIALLRGGTMNTVANSVGVPRARPETLLERLVRSYASGAPLRTTERTTMDVGGTLGFLFGTGVVYGFLAEYYAGGKPYPSPWTAVKTLARGSASAMIGGATVRRMSEPIEAELVVRPADGAESEHWPMRRYLAVAGGTVDQIGLGFRPFHRAGERPDAFHLVGIHSTPFQFVRRLPRVYRAQPMGDDRARDQLAREVELRTATDHVRYMIDGDLHETRGPLKIRVGPRVRIIVGV